MKLSNSLNNDAVDLVWWVLKKPLVNGLADELRALSIPVVGPSKKSAAILEESKIVSKPVYASGWDSDSEMHLARWCRERVAGIGRLDCDGWGW